MMSVLFSACVPEFYTIISTHKWLVLRGVLGARDKRYNFLKSDDEDMKEMFGVKQLILCFVVN